MHRTHNHQVAIQVASELGLPVFPVREKDTTYIDKKSGKTVTLKAKSPYTRNGFKDATKDLEEIDRLWAANRNAAVGVPMGPETSLLTVDIDNGPDKVGMQTWEHTGLIIPYTVKTRTVSGGLHLIFKHPNNCIIRNSAGTIFGPDVDVRADGGYIVWAGSILENGSYQYLPGHSPDEVQFADHTEVKRRQTHTTSQKTVVQKDLLKVETGIKRCVDLLLHSDTPMESIRNTLEELEAQKRALTRELSLQTEEDKIVLHPNIGELYARKIGDLKSLLQNDTTKH